MLSTISLRIILSHLDLFHSEDDFKLICGLDDIPECKKVYTKYNSFYKCIRRKHGDFYKGHTRPLQYCNYYIVPINEEDKEADDEPQVHAGDEDQEMDDLPIAHAIEELQNEHAILFLESYP